MNFRKDLWIFYMGCNILWDYLKENKEKQIDR